MKMPECFMRNTNLMREKRWQVRKWNVFCGDS